MEAKNLRIGNLVEYKITDSLDDRKEWWELNPIDVFDLQHLIEFPDDGFFRPIPLTEDWLLKSGFNKKGDYWFVNGEVEIEWLSGMGKFIFRLRYSENKTLPVREITYLHELQNTVWAVTGEELE